MIAAMNTASNRTPDYICGKPSKIMIDNLKLFNIDLSKACMVGDRLNTDIQMGIDSKMITLGVLT